MPWTLPKTWAATEMITEALLNTHIRDNLNWLKAPPFAQVVLTAQITTTSTSWTDATGLSLNLTTTGGNLMVGFSGLVMSDASGRVVALTVDVDGVNQGATDGVLVVEAAVQSTAFVMVLENIDAGAHTIKIRWKTSAGTATMRAENSSAWNKVSPRFWVREI